MIKILISGYSGFMGTAVRNIAAQNQIFEVVAGVDKVSHGSSCPVYASFDDVTCEVDVIIDFGAPTLTDSLLNYCERTKTAAVICTTGLPPEVGARIPEIAKTVPMFYSANMSLGANLLAKLCRNAAKLLADDFDIEVIEAHHRRKIDAPSGTALMLADEIRDAVSKEFDGRKLDYCFERSDRRVARPKDEIGIHAVRGGNIVGDHEVLFVSDSESLTLSHRAFSREVFAAGALKAARFLADKPAGLYSMDDVIVI